MSAAQQQNQSSNNNNSGGSSNNDMKTKILKGSALSVVLAATNAIGTAVFATSAETMLRASTVSYTLILASIGLFFVGWIFPKGIK